MPCSACEEARRQFLWSARNMDFGGMARQVARAAAINVDKLIGSEATMRVRFLKEWVGKPSQSITQKFPAGYVGDLPQIMADKAVFLGVAEILDPEVSPPPNPAPPEEPDPNAPNG